MSVMEVARNANKKKRKRKTTAEENDCSQAPAKAAKIHNEKKSIARRPHDGDIDVRSDLRNDAKKKKQFQKITRTDGNKRKPKMVQRGKEGKVNVITKDGKSKMKAKDIRKKTVTVSNDVKTKSAKPDDAAKLESMKKKERKKLRKMKSANFEMATRAKALWEECRRFDLTPEKKEACIAELFKLVHGHTKSLVFAHDTSRVIQTLFKYGTPEMKDTVFHELKDHLIDIMKFKYSKFFIKKLLAYGLKVHREFVFTAMHGKLRKLLRHREAVTVVESAYNNYANAKQRAEMAAEFYGKTFSVFRTPEERTLRAFVESHPDKRNEVIRFMKDSLSPLVDKSVVQHSFVHRLFYDFFTCAGNTERSEMIEVVREHVVHMLHTHDGSRVAMMCLWHGTAKDRKVLLKTMKSFVVKIAKEEFGHFVLLAAFDVVDDTKFVQKVILDELLQSLDAVADDKFGRKVLLYLLHPRDPLHFHPSVVQILSHGDNNQHSKKDSRLRHTELLSHISPSVTSWLSTNCRRLMSDHHKHPLVLSVISHCTNDVSDAMRAVAELAAEPFTPSSADKDDEGCQQVIDHFSGHRLLKRLIHNDVDRMKHSEQTVLFSIVLLDTVPTECLQSWTACNRGCFVLVSLLEINHTVVTRRVCSALAGMNSFLEQQKYKGAEILLNKLTAAAQ